MTQNAQAPGALANWRLLGLDASRPDPQIYELPVFEKDIS